jgi:hypothetical protein
MKIFNRTDISVIKTENRRITDDRTRYRYSKAHPSTVAGKGDDLN